MNNATGIINLARNIGGSVGIANVATLLSRRAQVHQAILVAHLTPYDAPYRNAAQGAQQMLMTQGSTSTLAHLQAQGLLYGNLVRQANMLAYVDAYSLLGLDFHRHDPLHVLYEERQAPRRRVRRRTLRPQTVQLLDGCSTKGQPDT